MLNSLKQHLLTRSQARIQLLARNQLVYSDNELRLEYEGHRRALMTASSEMPLRYILAICKAQRAFSKAIYHLSAIELLKKNSSSSEI